MRFVAVLAVAALASGCVTPYQRTGFTGGFSEYEEAPGVYRVEVNGNGYTSRSTLMGYFRRRIAELCAERGEVVADWEVGSESHRGRQTYSVRSNGRGRATVEPNYNPRKWLVSGTVRCAPRETPVMATDVP